MNWEPSRADHSIERATASATFITPLDANALDDLIGAGRRIAASHKLVARVDQIEPIEVAQGTGQIIEIGGAAQNIPRQVLFRRVDPEGIAVDEISLASRRIAAGTIRYGRWADLFSLVVDLFNGLHEAVPILGSLKTVRLEFVDRFNSLPEGGDHFEVVSRKSAYLPPVLGDKDAAMHVHSGWFAFESERIRKLTNVNIDVRDATAPASRRTISVLTMGQFEALNGALDHPIERLDELHGYLKAIFGDLITEEAAHRVALNK